MTWTNSVPALISRIILLGGELSIVQAKPSRCMPWTFSTRRSFSRAARMEVISEAAKSKQPGAIIHFDVAFVTFFNIATKFFIKSEMIYKDIVSDRARLIFRNYFSVSIFNPEKLLEMAPLMF